MSKDFIAAGIEDAVLYDDVVLVNFLFLSLKRTVNGINNSASDCDHFMVGNEVSARSWYDPIEDSEISGV